MDSRTASSFPIVASAKRHWVWWHESYKRDWLVALALITLSWFVRFCIGVRTGFHVHLNDFQLGYPFEPFESLVSWRTLFVLTVVFPIALMLGWHYWVKQRTNRSFNVHEIHHSVLGMCLSIALSTFIATLTCCVVGAPRPNYWNNTDDDDDDEGQRRSSFPSCCATALFASWTFVALMALGRFGSFHQELAPTANVLLSLLPLVVPIVFSLAQICDYTHRPIDVLIAALLGGACASVFYKVYFEELWTDNSGEPKQRSRQIVYTWFGLPTDCSHFTGTTRSKQVSLLKHKAVSASKSAPKGDSS